MTPEMHHGRAASGFHPIHPIWYLAVVLALAWNFVLLMHSHRLARALMDLQAASRAQQAQMSQLRQDLEQARH